MNRWVAAMTPLHCKPKENQNEKRKIDPERHTNRGEKKNDRIPPEKKPAPI
jgi:hypothetical protein